MDDASTLIPHANPPAVRLTVSSLPAKILPVAILAGLVALMGAPVTATAQVENEAAAAAPRWFETKDGRRFEAVPVALSAGGRDLQLRGIDGESFSLPIGELELDDQQFVKTWMAQQGPATDVVGYDAGVDLQVERSTEPARRTEIEVDGQSLDHDQVDQAYRIMVLNDGAESSSTLRLDYCLLYWNKISVYPIEAESESESESESGSESPVNWSSYGGGGKIAFVYRNRRMIALEPEDRRPLDAEALTLDRLSDATGTELGRDRPIGMRLRLTRPDGQVVADYCDFPEAYTEINWALLDVLLPGKLRDQARTSPVRGILDVDHARYWQLATEPQSTAD